MPKLPEATASRQDAPRIQLVSPAPVIQAIDLLPNIIPYGSISLLSGAAGLGKTALLAGMLKAFRDGTPIFGHQPNRVTDIGFINADRGWERGAKVWFDRVGFPEVKFYSMPDDPSFDPRCLRKKYERTMRLGEFIDKLKMPPGGLLNVDPMGLFLGGNLLNYDDCAVACHEIRKLLTTRGLTLLSTAHSGKLKADKKERYARLQDQILGSAALLGFSDTQMVLASPEETGLSVYTFLWQSHLAPAQTFMLSRDAQGVFQEVQVEETAGEGASRTATAKILALFPEDGAEITLGRLTELAADIPYTQKTVQRAVQQLIAEGQVEKVRRGYYRRVVPVPA